MKKFVFCFLFFCEFSYAGEVVKFNNADDTVIYHEKSADSARFVGDVHAVINPDLSQVLGVAEKYWKLSGGVIVSKTAEEIATQNALELASSTAAITNDALTTVDAFDSISLAQRGFALVTLDEINTLRQWLASFKVEVAAASSLADLKTRVATLPSTPDRTAVQLKNAVKSKISGGGAD